MTRPLCIDLYCGLGGWTEGFLAEGYECIGFDIERVTADGSPLCKHHQRLVDDVVKLADSKRKAHA